MMNLLVAIMNGICAFNFLIGIIEDFKHKEKTPKFIYFLFMLNLICFIINLICAIHQIKIKEL